MTNKDIKGDLYLVGTRTKDQILCRKHRVEVVKNLIAADNPYSVEPYSAKGAVCDMCPKAKKKR